MPCPHGHNSSFDCPECSRRPHDFHIRYPDPPGQFFTRLDFGLNERIDASDPDNIHLNYDLNGAKREFSNKALGDAHYIPLFKK